MRFFVLTTTLLASFGLVGCGDSGATSGPTTANTSPMTETSPGAGPGPAGTLAAPPLTEQQKALIIEEDAAVHEAEQNVDGTVPTRRM